MVTTLSRFIAWYIDKYRPFFQELKKERDLRWDEECERAFWGIKDHLGGILTLSKPNLGKPLMMYLAVSEHAMSGVLIREEGKEQILVY